MSGVHGPSHAAAVVLWHVLGDTAHGSPGSAFVEALLTAWVRADHPSRQRLAAAFPELAEALAWAQLGNVAELVRLASEDDR